MPDERSPHDQIADRLHTVVTEPTMTQEQRDELRFAVDTSRQHGTRDPRTKR